jgi:hypothetical protein
MHAHYENPEAAKLDEETVSNASPRMRMNCSAEQAAEKSTKSDLYVDKYKNRLFSKYLASRGFQSS